MANQGDKPDRFMKGQTISARDMNQLRELTPRLISGGSNTYVNTVGDRHLITSYNGIDGKAVLLQTMSIVQEHDDYLVCAPVTYNNTGPVIHSPIIGSSRPANVYVNVAKPRLLQKTPFHNQNVLLNGNVHTYVYTGVGQRNDTVNGITTAQQISPQYFPGDIIVTRRGPTGTFTVGGGGNLQNTNPMWYEDVNEGARAWVGSTVPSFSGASLKGSVNNGQPTTFLTAMTFSLGGSSLPNQTNYDTDNYLPTDGTSKLYVPSNGLYAVTASVSFSAAASPFYYEICFGKNSVIPSPPLNLGVFVSTIDASTVTIGTTISKTLQWSLYMNAGDYIVLYAGFTGYTVTYFPNVQIRKIN